MKKLTIPVLGAFLLFGLPVNTIVFADEAPSANTLTACGPDMGDPIPKEGEAILLEDYSTVENSIQAYQTINVNQVYSIRIQDIHGSCVNSARVTVSGSYQYDSVTATYRNIDLSAYISSVPQFWTVEITNQGPYVEYASLKFKLDYRVTVDDPYFCMVGGGYWYSGATFTIR